MDEDDELAGEFLSPAEQKKRRREVAARAKAAREADPEFQALQEAERERRRQEYLRAKEERQLLAKQARATKRLEEATAQAARRQAKDKTLAQFLRFGSQQAQEQTGTQPASRKQPGSAKN